MHPRYSDRMYQQEEVKAANPHPIMTGISSVVIFLGTIAFASLAIAAAGGCNSPPDTKCAEVGDCGDDEVDGGNSDQPDGNGGNCATNGTCPDAGSDTDAPSVTSCASNQWMENPPMFDCVEFSETGEMTVAELCDPELIPEAVGCTIKCLNFWATPEQLVIDEQGHSFDYLYEFQHGLDTLYRCRQILQ